tara:strand:+ start:8779 stop:9897 length:1119 start_codon:yes stop_codon:yes gene_type:complete
VSTSGFSITLRSYDEEIRDFLDSVLLGSPGGIQYRVHRETSMNQRHENIHFLCLSRNEELLGVVGLVNRVDITGKAWLFIRYLQIKRSLVPAKINRTAVFDRNALTRKKSRTQHISLIEEKLLEHLEEFSQRLATKNTLPAYAFVEDKNHRSMKLCNRFDFNKAQEIQTLFFHRFNPTSHSQIRLLTPDELQGMDHELCQFYDSYTAYHTEGLIQQGYFLGYWMNGEWVAITRIMRHFWDIERLPEHFSFLHKWKLDRWPYVRKVIPGQAFHFLTADYFWFKQGCEQYLEKVMEHALAKEEVNTVMLWLSKESPHSQVLKKSISWGFLKKLGNSGSVSLVMREFGGNREETQEIEVLKTKIGPTFINAHDMT